ncbi:hypothetical protein L9F63_007168, partial [Diploptera punctata]
IEICRKSLMELQNKIREFKRTNDESFQRLSEEESILTDEIMFLESKTDEWNQPINNSVLKPVVKSISKSYISNTDNTRKEILEFQKFLQDHGGHTGGWSEEDHLLFLRLRNKSKGKITFLSLLRQHFPDISADAMLLHEEWYQQYENLKEKQREAIKDWKATKMVNTCAQTTDIKQKKVESKEDAEKKKQKILEWKRTLQLKKELENKKHWEEKQKELEREKKRREIQELKKAEVERYKEDKLNEQHTKMVLKQMKELQELEQRAAQANTLLKGFR